jgi:hypothetical protein
MVLEGVEKAREAKGLRQKRKQYHEKVHSDTHTRHKRMVRFDGRDSRRREWKAAADDVQRSMQAETDSLSFPKE